MANKKPDSKASERYKKETVSKERTQKKKDKKERDPSEPVLWQMHPRC